MEGSEVVIQELFGVEKSGSASQESVPRSQSFDVSVGERRFFIYSHRFYVGELKHSVS